MAAEVSVVINTKNAAETLKDTLQSVKWADEIVVVDMLSSDNSKAIAKKFTEKIYDFKEDVSYVEPARNFALSKAKFDWVLLVDADEIISSGLKKKIETVVTQDPDVSCYFIARKNIIFGKWIQKTGWWPDYQPRLFRRGKVKWRNEIHSQPIIEGQIEYLPVAEDLAIEHHNYRSVSDYLQRLDRYTTISAKEGKSQLTIQPSQLIDTYRQELMRRLFAEEGISEDVHGIALSFLQSTYQLVVELKAWELQGCPLTHQPKGDVMKAVEQLQRELAYWLAAERVANSQGVTKKWWQLKKRISK